MASADLEQCNIGKAIIPYTTLLFLIIIIVSWAQNPILMTKTLILCKDWNFSFRHEEIMAVMAQRRLVTSAGCRSGVSCIHDLETVLLRPFRASRNKLNFYFDECVKFSASSPFTLILELYLTTLGRVWDVGLRVRVCPNRHPTPRLEPGHIIDSQRRIKRQVSANVSGLLSGRKAFIRPL